MVDTEWLRLTGHASRANRGRRGEPSVPLPNSEPAAAPGIGQALQLKTSASAEKALEAVSYKVMRDMLFRITRIVHIGRKDLQQRETLNDNPSTTPGMRGHPA
jgi:hypothetical protein